MNCDDLSTIKEGEYPVSLIEKMAEQVHLTWQRGRAASGWRFGKERDDAGKLHPCLVPYADLPEEEKEYDRATVQAVLSVLNDSGCEISRQEKKSNV